MRHVEQKPISSYAHLYQVFKKHGVLHEQMAYVPPAVHEFGPSILQAREVYGAMNTGQVLQDRSILLENCGYRGYTALEVNFFEQMWELCEGYSLNKVVGIEEVLKRISKEPFNKRLQRDVVRYILVELYKHRKERIGDTTCFVPMDVFALLRSNKDVYGCLIDDETLIFINIKQSFEHLRVSFADTEKPVSDIKKYATAEDILDNRKLYRFRNDHDIFSQWEDTQFDSTYMEIFPMPVVARSEPNTDDTFIYLFDPQQFTIFTQPINDFDGNISWIVTTTHPGVFLK